MESPIERIKALEKRVEELEALVNPSEDCPIEYVPKKYVELIRFRDSIDHWGEELVLRVHHELGDRLEYTMRFLPDYMRDTARKFAELEPDIRLRMIKAVLRNA